MPPAEKGVTKVRKVTQPACDACHMRRVKCSHEQPCDHCRRLGLECTYIKASQARKSTGKRIEQLRSGGSAVALAAAAQSTPAVASAQQGERGDGAVKQEAAAAGSQQYPQAPYPAGLPPPPPGFITPGPPMRPNNYASGSGAEHQQPQQQPQQQRSPFPFDGPPARSRVYSGPLHTSYSSSAGGSSGSGGSTSASAMMPPPDSPRSATAVSPGSMSQHRLQPLQHYSPRSGSNGAGSPNAGGAFPPQLSQGLPQPFLSPRSNHPLASTYAAPSSTGHHERHHPYRPPPPPMQQQQHHQQQQHPHQHQHQPQQQQQPMAPVNMMTAAEASFVDQLLAQRSANGQGSMMADAQQQQQQYNAQRPPAPGGPYIPSLTPNFDINANYRLPDLTTSLADSFLGAPGTAGLGVDSLMWGSGGTAGSEFPLIPGDGSHTMLDAIGRLAPADATPLGLDAFGVPLPNVTTPSVSGASNYDSDALLDSVLIPTLALFYERMSGIMPVFSRAWLFSRLDRDHQHSDPQFASMLLAMSALVHIQAEDTTDRPSARKRRRKAIGLLEESTKLRDSLFFGQHPCLEAVCTSFFIFASLFALGEHNAAWFRLREAVTLSHLARLHEPSAYEGLEKDEQERRLRTYWLLAITERAYALQYGHPLTITGHPRATTANLRAKLGLKELSDFPVLQLHLFDAVDETFVDCFLGKCKNCQNYTRQKAVELHKAFSKEEGALNEGGAGAASSANGSERPASRGSKEPEPFARSAVQRADYEISRHWLSNRAWLVSLSHGLLSINDEEESLRVDYALTIARQTLDTTKTLGLQAIEVHGIGIALKFYDIAATLVLLCQDASLAQTISESAVARSKQGGEASPSSERGSAHRLRTEVTATLDAYIAFFKRFLDGNHPYLPKLLEISGDLISPSMRS